MEILVKRIKDHAKSPLVNTEEFRLHNDENLKVSAIISGADAICRVLESDARQYNVTRQQLALDDFYVSYKLVVSTKRLERMIRIQSNLHQDIQDRFAEAGVEIMSPHYRANRSGEKQTLPVV